MQLEIQLKLAIFRLDMSELSIRAKNFYYLKNLAFNFFKGKKFTYFLIFFFFIYIRKIYLPVIFKFIFKFTPHIETVIHHLEKFVIFQIISFE